MLLPTTHDISGMLEEIEAGRGRPNAFGRWLERNPEAAGVFWELMEKGYRDRDQPFSRCIAVWRKHFPDAPKPTNQNVKTYVDAQLAER